MAKASTTTSSKAKPVYTEKKAERLVRVYQAVLGNGFLLVWLQATILSTMKEEDETMKHMDPSEIMMIPFSLQRTTAFCTLPAVMVLLLWLYRTPSLFTHKFLSFIKLTFVLYGVLGLCGANQIVTYPRHSLNAAMYLATLLSTTWTGDKVTSNTLEELPFFDFRTDMLATSRLYMTLMLTISFSILTILDRGFQMQRWPLPIVLGGTYGYMIGSVVGLCISYFEAKSKPKAKADA